jgi:two-component system chemotaxis sensor kinase CheA
MSVDLAQFYQVFFEESEEGLDVMEAALMQFDSDAADAETINTIFRAAHSIKGGSATFGFTAVSSFTHVLETFLDQVRNGDRILDGDSIDMLLRSVDCLRDMFSALKAGQEPDAVAASELQREFERRLAGEQEKPAKTKKKAKKLMEKKTAADSESIQEMGGASGGYWRIDFTPGIDMLRTGNEPMRMFGELAELGQLTVSTRVDGLPAFSEVDAEACYLSWQLDLVADVDESRIREVFEWVIDDARLIITRATSGASSVPEQASVPSTRASEVMPANVVAMESVKVARAAEVLVDSGAPDNADRKLKAAATADTSIRVSIEKIDQLINMVGELVITQSMLGQIGQNFSLEKLASLQEGLGQLERNTRELQESVMQIRMLPISFAFSRFPRMVRDLAKRLGKQIDLVLKGESTELDKTVMEKIGDPLVHLVRNSLDHGIELPEVRRSKGKPPTGTITLNAYHQGGNVIIEIIDDGAGLNRDRITEKARENGLIGTDAVLSDDEVCEMIFKPGFSTAREVSDVSGRGVGMDVVRRNIQELNGTVEVRTRPGQGSTFTIRLPLTLAILDGQLVRVGSETYVFPLVSIVESMQANEKLINQVAGGCDVFRLRNEYVPIVDLASVFSVQASYSHINEALLVVVECDNQKIGIVVDELLAQQQVVIKSLETNFRRVEGISGATILGDGTVALIADIGGIARMAGTLYGNARLGIPAQQTLQRSA